MGSIRLTLNSESVRSAISELEALGDFEAKAKRALEAGAQAFLPIAVAATPQRTGRMVGYMQVKKRGRGAGASVEVGPIGSSVAHLVEGGHGGPRPAPAHPFLQPAFEQAEDMITQVILDELTSGL